MLRNGTLSSATTLLGGVGLALLSACNQASVNNAAPRLSSSIPRQSTGSGSTFSLDLADYVSDRETDTNALAYTVVSGGGNFSGTTYTNTFTSFGKHRVTVRVTDPQGKSLDTAFDVDVLTANLGVIASTSDLRLLDTDTLQVRTFANGSTLTVRGTLGRGLVAYERQNGSDHDLFLYDAFTPRTFTLGDDANAVERYAGKVGDSQVVFTVENGTGETLKVFDARTQLTQAVNLTTTAGSSVGTVLVDSLGVVYFEYGNTVDNSGAGIYEYDVASGATRSVAGSGRTLQQPMTGGGVLFAGVSGGALTHLGFAKRNSAVNAIATEPATTVSFRVATSGRVAYDVNAGVRLWNPLDATSTPVAIGGAGDRIALALPSGNFVLHTASADVVLWDTAASATRTFPASAVADTAVGNLGDSRVIVSKAEGTGVHLYLATYASGVVTEAPIATAASNDFALVQVLANDNIVFRNTTSNTLLLFRTGASATTSLAAGAQFVAEMPTSGDFVFKVDNGGQFDLSLWDDSALATVTVANANTDEELATGGGSGRIVFTREVSGGTARNLFVWEPVGNTVTQLTDDMLDHTLGNTFAADNR